MMRRSAEQLDDDRMLRESARNFLEARCAWTPEPRSAAMFADWHREIAELGWFAAGLPEELGGLGADSFQGLSLIEEAGRVLLPLPLATDILIMPWLMRRLPKALASLAEPLAAGRARFGIVREDVRSGGLRHMGGKLSGRGHLSLDAAAATHWVVLAGMRSVGDAALLCVEAAGAGFEPVRLLDGRSGALPRFSGSEAAVVLATGDEAIELAAEIEDRAVAALLADAYGALAAGLALTVDYLNQRKQFGQSLGSFQAVQHLMADAFCDLETLRSLALWTATALTGEPAERTRAAASAKIALGREGLAAASRLIQVSGGIAMTEDYRIGHIYKRLQVSAALHGGTESHIDKLAALSLPPTGRNEG